MLIVSAIYYRVISLFFTSTDNSQILIFKNLVIFVSIAKTYNVQIHLQIKNF